MRHRHRLVVVGGWIIGVLLTGPAGGAEEPAAPQGPTAQEIVKHADDLLRGDTVRGRMAMTVTTPQWQRRLEFEVWSHGRTRMFIRLLAPAKEAGVATLRIDDNMWNYLPQVERTIKIPPSLMLQPWMGSDFTNDDMVKESSIVHDYTHRILGEGTVDGAAVYRVEMIPKPEAAVTWGKRLSWVRTGDFVPLREEYYDERGTLIKVLTYSQIRPVSDRVLPTVWTMETVTKPGHRTAIEILDATYNQPIEESVFTQANLKRSSS